MISEKRICGQNNSRIAQTLYIKQSLNGAGYLKDLHEILCPIKNHLFLPILKHIVHFLIDVISALFSLGYQQVSTLTFMYFHKGICFSGTTFFFFCLCSYEVCFWAWNIIAYCHFPNSMSTSQSHSDSNKINIYIYCPIIESQMKFTYYPSFVCLYIDTEPMNILKWEAF